MQVYLYVYGFTDGDTDGNGTPAPDLTFRYKRTGDSEPTYLAKQLSLVDLTITDSANANAGELDLYKAVRVQFSTGSAENQNILFASDHAATTQEQIVTDTYGQLDLDGDNNLDTALVYDWQSPGSAITYGVSGSQQTACNAAYRGTQENPVPFKKSIGNIPNTTTGLTVTVTIWIEGWQMHSGVPTGNKDTSSEAPSSAIWDPAVYNNFKFNVGMRFQAEDIVAPAPQNP